MRDGAAFRVHFILIMSTPLETLNMPHDSRPLYPLAFTSVEIFVAMSGTMM